MNQLQSILFTGQTSSPNSDPNEEAAQVIQLLSKIAKTQPIELLVNIKAAADNKTYGMIPLSFAILICQAPEEFLIKEKNNLIKLLQYFGAGDLLELVDWLRDKSFGKGFGVRPQKWIKAVMEGWTKDILIAYANQRNTDEFVRLIKLVHPRYRGERGEIIQIVLGKKSHKE